MRYIRKKYGTTGKISHKQLSLFNKETLVKTKNENKPPVQLPLPFKDAKTTVNGTVWRNNSLYLCDQDIAQYFDWSVLIGFKEYLKSL